MQEANAHDGTPDEEPGVSLMGAQLKLARQRVVWNIARMLGAIALGTVVLVPLEKWTWGYGVFFSSQMIMGSGTCGDGGGWVGVRGWVGGWMYGKIPLIGTILIPRTHTRPYTYTCQHTKTHRVGGRDARDGVRRVVRALLRPGWVHPHLCTCLACGVICGGRSNHGMAYLPNPTAQNGDTHPTNSASQLNRPTKPTNLTARPR